MDLQKTNFSAGRDVKSVLRLNQSWPAQDK